MYTEKIEKDGKKEGILFIDEINCVSETLSTDDAAIFAVQDVRQSGDPGGLADCGSRKSAGVQ